MAASTLTLVLPPVSLSDSESTQFVSSLTGSEKSLVTLRKLFSLGELEAHDSYSIALARIFGLPYEDADTFPTAAIMARGCGIDSSTGYWLCAEPVHLHPDLDHVVLFDSSTFELTKHELAQLVSEINELFLESDITAHHGKQLNLFIRTHDKPDVSFSSLASVTGNNILQHLPEGKDAAKWRLLQNEIQMQMTQSIINHEREQRGLVSVNGLWFWGGGYLLRAKYKQVYDAVFANDVFTQGLATLTSTRAEKACAGFGAINPEKNTLVAIDAPDDNLSAWLEMLLDIEKQWLKPAFALIKKQELQRLVLVTGKVRVSFTREQQRRFWTRTIKAKAMADLL